MNDCLFCKLAADPKVVIWENDNYAAFKDIHPKAKTHLLLVPKAHIASLDQPEAFEDGNGLIQAIQEVANFMGISGAYRVQFNVGRQGGQEIDHLHAHVLSDR